MWQVVEMHTRSSALIMTYSGKDGGMFDLMQHCKVITLKGFN